VKRTKPEIENFKTGEFLEKFDDVTGDVGEESVDDRLVVGGHNDDELVTATGSVLG